MSKVASRDGTQGTSSALATVLSVGAVLATFGSLGFISVNELPPREAFAHPLNIVGSIVAMVGLFLLSLGLMRWRTRLPSWAVAASAAGLWVAGANAFTHWATTVAAATKTNNDLFAAMFFESPWVIAGQVPKSLLCLVGLLALAISGWRQRSIPRHAAVVLGVAAIVSVWPPYPPGLLLFSLAIFLIARAGVVGAGVGTAALRWPIMTTARVRLLCATTQILAAVSAGDCALARLLACRMPDDWPEFPGRSGGERLRHSDSPTRFRTVEQQGLRDDPVPSDPAVRGTGVRGGGARLRRAA